MILTGRKWPIMQNDLVHHVTGGKFAVAGQQIAGASENFVLNY
jgi:hypothetical protein